MTECKCCIHRKICGLNSIAKGKIKIQYCEDYQPYCEYCKNHVHYYLDEGHVFCSVLHAEVDAKGYCSNGN